MLVLDTSAIVALGSSDDPHHEAAVKTLNVDEYTNQLVVPAAILSEAAFVLEKRFSSEALDSFLMNIERGMLSIDSCLDDVPRIRQLLRSYPTIGFCDCAVVACAERHGSPVFTFDTSDFGRIARDEKSIEVVP